MKIIDLLNKIANGEDVPKKIKYRDIIFDYKKEKGDYESEEGQFFLDWVYLNEYGLHDEIEIIEEDKKIEPLECYVNAILTGCISKYYEEDFEKSVKHNIDVLGTKINEIIDKINKMEEK